MATTALEVFKLLPLHSKRCFFSGDYINTDLVYEDITDVSQLKKTMADFLDEYNNTPGVVAMDLVLFRDACEHGKKEMCNTLYIMLKTKYICLMSFQQIRNPMSYF